MKPAAQRSRHLAPGDKLGKYEVIRQIAMGGMAELYLARTSGIEGFEKLVVLKRILPQYVSNASFINMFLNEARIAATLHHANIAQVYDIGVEEGDYFFAMEYVHGEDLDHMLIAAEEQGVPISMDAALTLVAGLCAGLHYAHEKASAEGKPLSIVHRDVSPSNVLVSYDGSVKLVDFGIARAASRSGTTHGSGIKGKIAYMSPEQCQARAQLDRRSDVYAVGTILYELSTGQLPFKGETEYQVLNQIVNEDPSSPMTIVPSYPPALERIVLRALARRVEYRYPTALALQTDIEDFAHEMRLRISPLVLARLMGTLFPARLEEWDHARAQGAFFVEQHVVRTLIESGKTPDPEARAELAAALAREEAERAAMAGDDDETTAISGAPPQHDDTSDTMVGAPPMMHSGTLPIPPPPVTEEHVVLSPPQPRPPTPYPVVSELASATPGSLITATTSYGVPIEKVPDLTERVRVPPKRHTSPTTFVRTEKRRPLIALVAAVAVAGGIAAYIAMRNVSDSRPVAKTVEPVVQPEPAKLEEPKQPEPAKVEAKVAPESKREPAKIEEPKQEPPKTEPLAPEPKKELAKLKPKPKPVAKPKTEPKKPKGEDATWDADSPFMPVRTEKR